MVTHDDQSGGQKTFRLARLFHTEDCYRARGLTAEDLVRRTFIGVDADTFRKLDRLGSYYDVTNCEDWHWRLDERLQYAPTCRDIADVAERLGFYVQETRWNDGDHFNFFGVRYVTDYGCPVAAQCRGCECRCDHDMGLRGSGCESCDCPCEGCYCADNCDIGHPEIMVDPNDPLMNLSAADANSRYRSRRFKLRKYDHFHTIRHTDDCKFFRSFTADELLRLTLEPSSRGHAGSVTYSDWLGGFERYFESVPTSREFADALMRRGIRISSPFMNELDWVDGFDLLETDRGAFDAFWLGRPFLGCSRYRPCDCLCTCEPTGCAACDCQCEGCSCTGTCAEGHPVVLRVSDPSLSRAWRKLALVRNQKRYEMMYAKPWHAQDCPTARWLTVDQIVWLNLTHVGEHTQDGLGLRPWCQKPDSSNSRTRCGMYSIDQYLTDHAGPSCTEVADAARRIGIRVEPLPKRWPWERTHYKLLGVKSGDILRLESEPSCTGCDCFCKLCDDCSNCPCDCAGCVCSAKCRTGECSTVHEVISNRPRKLSEIERRLGTRAFLSIDDLKVSNALLRLEQEAGTTSRLDGGEGGNNEPTFELLAKADWHLEDCEHSTKLKLTADELVYATLRRMNDDVVNVHERKGIALYHANCESWRDANVELLGSGPTCEQLAASAERLGYRVKPVEGFRRHYSFDYEKIKWKAHVSDERQVHYVFPNAALDPHLRISGLVTWRDENGYRVPQTYFIPVGQLDEMRCDGRCKCRCTHSLSAGQCECAGCYCRRTCVPARSDE